MLYHVVILKATKDLTITIDLSGTLVAHPSPNEEPQVLPKMWVPITRNYRKQVDEFRLLILSVQPHMAAGRAPTR